jgi:hypothetical protein
MVIELLLFSFVSSTVEGRLATTLVRMELLVFLRVIAIADNLTLLSCCWRLLELTLDVHPFFAHLVIRQFDSFAKFPFAVLSGECSAKWEQSQGRT